MNMRKFLLGFVLCLGAFPAFADTVDIMTSYIYSSDFDQVRLGTSLPLSYNAAIGLEGKYVADKISTANGGLKDPVYSIYVPMRLELETARFDLVPFYYFENKPHQPAFKEAQAYGVSFQLTMDLVKDEVEDLHTQAYLITAYARQKASVLADDAWNNQYYDQAAFTLGFRQSFYSAFSFNVAGTAYQYPDGISHVQGFRGILDQKDLGFTQSFDVNRALGKYALSARLTRFWVDKHSSLYVGYHYQEFYTANPEHSVLIGNSFYITRNVYADMAYNHVRNTDNTNKRDLFFVNLNFAF